MTLPLGVDHWNGLEISGVPNQFIVNVDPESLIRMPSILKEVPLVLGDIGDDDFPLLAWLLHDKMDVSVAVEDGAAITRGVVIHVVLHVVEIHPHRSGDAMLAMSQVSDALVIMSANVNVLSIAIHLDRVVDHAWHVDGASEDRNVHAWVTQAVSVDDAVHVKVKMVWASWIAERYV